MGNTPSGHEGRNTRLSKNSRSKEPSPEPNSLSNGAPYNHQHGPPHASIASVLQQQSTESQSTLRQVNSDETPDASNTNLHYSASNESFAHFVTPQASNTQLVSPSHNSTGFDPKRVDLKSALAILEELRKTASPEDLVALHRALLPVRTDASFDETSAAANPARHDSFAAPTITPKAANGLPVVERKPVARSTSWIPGMLGASPLSKLEKLGKEGSDAENAIVPPRATTPADMEHLGAMKLGTLVVINGTPASPGTSHAETGRGHNKTLQARRQDEEYFTAEESEEDASSNVRRQSTEPSKAKREENFGGPLRIDTAAVQSASTSTVDSNSTLRANQSGSPLKNQISRDSSVKSATTEQTRSSHDDSSELQDSTAEKRRPLKKRRSSRKRLSKAEPVRTSTTRMQDLVGDEFDDPEPLAEPPNPRDPAHEPKSLLINTSRHSRHLSAISAADLASEYQAGLPDSPFSTVSPLEPKLPESSNPDANVASASHASNAFDDDELFISGPVSSEPPANTLVSPATDNDDINPYAPWHSHAVTRQTALGSHPVLPSEQSSLLSPSDASSVRPTSSTRPSQHSDSGYSTASHNGQAKSPVETFAQTRLEIEHATNDYASSRDTSPFEPILHHSMLGTDDDQAAPLSNTMGLRPALTTRSSTVSSVVYSPVEQSDIKSSDMSKSWRTSRLRLSRILSSDSSSSKDQTPVPMAAALDNTTTLDKPAKGSKTPKKLQKKRPTSALPAPAFGLSIPDIPAGLASKFGDRLDLFEEFDGSHAHIERRIILTDAHAAITQDPRSNRPVGAIGAAEAHAAPVSEPMHPSRAPPPLPRSASAVDRGSQQRRASLPRFLRPRSSVNGDSTSSYADDEPDGYLYPPEFASMGSITQSLGASPYDFARSKPESLQNNVSKAHVLPFPRAQRPKAQDRRRPKSYHGRSVARKMEMVGEESIEDIAHDDMMSARHNQRPSMESARSEHEQQHNRRRPKSSGQAEARHYAPYRDSSLISHPLPPMPIQNKPSWSGPRDTWRQHRELASRNVQNRQSEQYASSANASPANLGTMVIGGPALSPIDLPAIGATPRSRPQSQPRQHFNVSSQQPPPLQLRSFHNMDISLRRPRPLSTLVSAKSQPDLRTQARFYADGKVEVGQAQRIYQYPAGSPAVSLLTKKQAWMMAHEV